MHCLTVNNVNDALVEALHWIHVSGVERLSRNGPVRVAPASVAVTYRRPTERVLFSALRDCNPYFHFFESLWMLGGRADVDFVAQFAPRMKEYSDDEASLHGAYGHRWRHWGVLRGQKWPGRDQLASLAKMLRNDPDTRRAVLSMWDPDVDLAVASKDLPCNTHCYFDRRGETKALNLMICCRSNDAVWGAYGANAVHFSYLLEYVAAMVGCQIGEMHQLSFNLHVYTQNEVVKRLHHPGYDAGDESLGAPRVLCDDRYLEDGVEPYGLLGGLRESPDQMKEWNSDLAAFLSDPGGDTAYRYGFFSDVAAPMYASWTEYRRGDLDLARTTLDSVEARDWAVAADEWLFRRIQARARKETE